jgi:hypothetical protein
MMNVPQCLTATAGLCLALAAAPAGAVSVGTTTTFQDGTTGGWYVPVGSPLPPQVIDTGGPAGTDDGFLQLKSSGQSSAGSRLVVFGGNDWLGNYMAAGVTAVTLDAINLGPSDLQLRLYLNGPAGSALSTTGLSLPAASGWTQLVFALAPAALSGANAAATLANVTELRLFHNDSPSFPPGAVLATLGIDNISAVPEPGPLALWAAAAGLGFVMRRRTGPASGARRSAQAAR